VLVSQIDQPFDSIESAHDFMDVLAQTVLDAMTELHAEEQKAVREGHLRKAQAISLALFKCKTLSCHVHKSRRALNDLRTLRRLILDGDATVERAMAMTA
jgi:hypothetical protein